MHTDWEVFKTAASQGDQIDFEENPEVVSSFIAKCTEDVTVIKSFTACGNRKLWITTEVCSLLTARDAAIRAGDTTASTIIPVAKKSVVSCLNN